MKRHDSAVPGGAALALRRLAVSRPEAIVLAAVAAMLVPLLMLEGGAFRLPSLLERGVEFLIPGLADGNARGEPAVLPSRTGTLAGVTAGAAVVLPVRSAPASRGGISVASGTSRRRDGQSRRSRRERDGEGRRRPGAGSGCDRYDCPDGQFSSADRRAGRGWRRIWHRRGPRSMVGRARLASRWAWTRRPLWVSRRDPPV